MNYLNKWPLIYIQLKQSLLSYTVRFSIYDALTLYNLYFIINFNFEIPYF